MDLSSFTGILFIAGILSAVFFGGGSHALVFDPLAVTIVVGGSLSVLLIRHNIKNCYYAFLDIKMMFRKVRQDQHELMIEIIDLAQKSRKDGLLSLEQVSVKNEFLKQGLQHLVDGLDSQTIRNILTKEMVMHLERQVKSQQIFRALGDIAPAMGMIGTVLGLVQMLSHLSDPSSIGPAMAVAMLTTLYGAMLAHIVALPIADKMAQINSEEMMTKSMIIDAIISMHKKQNPRIIYDLLKSYLPKNERRKKVPALIS